MSGWDSDAPFVYDADGFVVGLKCAPPHHAEMLRAGWEGGENLFPLVQETAEAFTADVLVYRRGGGPARTFTLPERPPYIYRGA